MESDAAKVFLEVGSTVDDHVFGITSADEVLSEYGIEDGKIVLFKKVRLYQFVSVIVLRTIMAQPWIKFWFFESDLKSN